MKIKLYVIIIILIGCLTAFAGDKVNLPANSRIFFSEEDCFEVMKLHYNWNIEFAERVREMGENGKFIKYPHNVLVEVIEKKSYKMFNYYKVSIYNSLTKQYEIFWTDAVRFD